MDSGRALLSPLHSPADCGCGILAVLLIYQVYAKFFPIQLQWNSCGLSWPVLNYVMNPRYESVKIVKASL